MEVLDDTFIPPGLSEVRTAGRHCPRCVWPYLQKKRERRFPVSTIRSAALCTILALAALGLGACGGGDGKTVDVDLADYTLKPEVSSVAAGEITFKLHNNGTFQHEMVVFKVADASTIPTKPSGEVDETGVPEAANMGEVEDVLPDTTKTLKLDLPAGKYVLFCNSLDGKIAHFKEGMHAEFTVTE